MKRIMLITDQTDFCFLRDLQLALRNTRSHILSVESAYCASINVSRNVTSDLYMLYKRKDEQSAVELSVDIRKDAGLVAVTALVIENFEDLILKYGYNLYEISPLPNNDHTRCKIKLIPIRREVRETHEVK